MANFKGITLPDGTTYFSEGTEHSFPYSPDQLVGNYFTLVL